MILTQSEFYLSAASEKRHQCSQQDLQKIRGNSLPNTPLPVRCQALEEESYLGEIELENEGSNENWRVNIIFKTCC